MPREDAELKHVVALGGSAGALPVILRQLDRLFHKDSSTLFIVWHRAPGALFRLEDHVPDDVSFGVEVARENVAVRPNVAYYPHDSNDLEVRDGRLYVAPPAGHYRPSIDRLFTSLASEYGDKVIGVLLSGGGTDGVRGLADVRARGGVTIAQDPATATVSGLPRAAIAAGVVDHVLATREILQFVDRTLEGERPALPGGSR